MNTVALIPIGLIGRSRIGENAYGNDTYGETITVVRGTYNPGGSSESTEGQDQVVQQPTVYLPDRTLTAIDAVIVDIEVDEHDGPILDEHGNPSGDRYEISGEPLRWPANPFTGQRRERPLEVRLERVAG